jgi:hypothetical protein
MQIANMISRVFSYLSEGIARIFSPDRDEYPKTGVQPFEGEIYREHHADW